MNRAIYSILILVVLPAPIYADYCKDWMRAFLQLAMDNVGYEGGREITPEQNDRLLANWDA